MTDLFSVKMRASKMCYGKSFHISGAERIVPQTLVADVSSELLLRAQNHSKGSPDNINLKVERIDETNIIYLNAIPVETLDVCTWQDGRNKISELMHQSGIANVDEIMELFKDTYAMRGAMLLDIDTMERLEPDKERGIRATYMDYAETDMSSVGKKNHFAEALILATKVVSHPNIIAEICVSDDPDYVTGYFASKELGYVRITKLKEFGSADGGRIFLYRGSKAEIQNCIDYIQKQPVLVRK